MTPTNFSLSTTGDMFGFNDVMINSREESPAESINFLFFRFTILSTVIFSNRFEIPD